MKKLIFILVVTIFSCSKKDETNETVSANTYTLVFFDKTQSVNPHDSFVRNKYQQALRKLVDENINQEGDILEVYFIHENTPKARVATIRPRTLKSQTAGLSPTDQEAAKLTYDMEIKKERQLVYETLIKSLLEPNKTASNNETNVSGSVSVVSQACDKNSKVKAYFFSDMVESMKNGRDFHRSMPEASAEKWAKEDAQKYASHNLTNAEITVILPFSPNSSSKENNPSVTDYWEVFFGELGVRRFSEN